MGASGTDNFCLRWNDFAENVSGAFKDLRAESDFFDVTLACSDSGARTLQAHKVILSACSNFFKTTFRQQMNANKHPNPYIYLRGVTYNDLASILDFIYNGEVNVAQEDLNSFLAVAEELQIKGLTNRDSTSGAENSNSNSKRPKVRPMSVDQCVVLFVGILYIHVVFFYFRCARRCCHILVPFAVRIPCKVD
mgnify:CR=1 FL=1